MFHILQMKQDETKKAPKTQSTLSVALQKNTILVYSRTGNDNLSNYYGRLYLQLSDSLEFGKRQKLAATVYNKYNLEQKKEQKLKDEKGKHRSILTLADRKVSSLNTKCRPAT